MPKYRIHFLPIVRYFVDVEADSVDAAIKYANDTVNPLSVIPQAREPQFPEYVLKFGYAHDGVYAGWNDEEDDEVLVDPWNETKGEFDIDNSLWYSFDESRKEWVPRASKDETRSSILSAYGTAVEASEYFGEMDSASDLERWQYVRDWLEGALRSYGIDIEKEAAFAKSKEYTSFAPSAGDE